MHATVADNIPSVTFHQQWKTLLLRYQVIMNTTADLFSADRKWIPAVEILSAIKDGHLTVKNLLLVSFHHRLYNFSTQNEKHTIQCFHRLQTRFGPVVSRDVRISAPAIRIRPDFHYPAKSASGRIAGFMPDRIGTNYYDTIPPSTRCC